MREVSISAFAGRIVLALVMCSLVGCVMPSRESLKEPGWSPTSGRGPATGGKPGATSLIKPFIPSDKPDLVPQRPVDTLSGFQQHPTMTATHEPMPEQAPLPEAAVHMPPQPVPRPVRWHDPSPDRSGPVRPAIEPSPEQPPMEDEQPLHVRPLRTDVEDYPPLAAMQPRSPVQAPPAATQPTPPVQAPPAATQQPQPAPAPPAAMHPTPAWPAPPRAQRDQADAAQRYASETNPRQPEATARPVSPEVSAPPVAAGAVEAKSGSREWEDQRVKQAAFKQAKESAGVKKGKICYSVKNDEWWVVLYEDAGAVYEVKQYTWDRSQEKLERFLVSKRIGKNRLEEDLSVREADKACEAIDFP